MKTRNKVRDEITACIIYEFQQAENERKQNNFIQWDRKMSGSKQGRNRLLYLFRLYDACPENPGCNISR